MEGIFITTEKYLALLSSIERIELVLQKNSNSSSEEILSIEEACQYLKVSSRTLQNYRDKNLISFFQLGKKILFRKSDILTFLQNHIIN